MGVPILVGNETKQCAGQMPGRNLYCLYFKGSAYSTVFQSAILWIGVVFFIWHYQTVTWDTSTFIKLE